MVSQGDISLLQRITQPGAQSQSVCAELAQPSGSEGKGEGWGGTPLHTALELGLLSGETAF